MSKKNFTYVVELTNKEIIKKLDEFENQEDDCLLKIGKYDIKKGELILRISKDSFKIKLEQKKNAKKHFLLQIDNAEYIDPNIKKEMYGKRWTSKFNKILGSKTSREALERKREELKKLKLKTQKKMQESNMLIGKKFINLRFFESDFLIYCVQEKYTLTNKGKDKLILSKNNFSFGKMLAMKDLSEDALTESYTLRKMINSNRVKLLKADKNQLRIPSAVIKISENNKSQKSEIMGDTDLKNYLFCFFEKHPECYFKEITKSIDQPKSIIRRILQEICDIKKVRQRHVFSLKEIYRS